MKKAYRYVLVVLVIVALAVLPLLIYSDGEFGGTDDQAVAVIQNIDNNYRPWFKGFHFYESTEISSTIFALQAAIGAGVLGYYIGYSRGKQTKKGH
jgi:cobalt/nickel transport protein